MSQVKDSGLSLEQRWKKGRFVRLSAARTEKKVKPGTAAHGSTNDIDGVRPEIWPTVSDYVDEFPS